MMGGCRGWMTFVSRRARDRSAAVAWQFAPGRYSRPFFRVAAATGADQFSYEPPGVEGPAPARTLERRSSDFERRWPAYKDEFESLTSGSAEARFLGAPPFERYYLRIEFKDGRVLTVTRRLID